MASMVQTSNRPEIQVFEEQEACGIFISLTCPVAYAEMPQRQT